ncbi:MAG: NAD(+)/NADH kinase [Magnetococcales bacterium]|nr:NAD(+)/NADH kinase [Magnetococcales bacterium]
MHRIGIIHKHSEPRALEATALLVRWLNRRGCEVSVAEEGIPPEYQQLPPCCLTPQDLLPEGQDLVVVLGGDGTFIAASRSVGDRDTPLLGINMGRLGFLTEVPYEEMLVAIEHVLHGRGHLEERMQLEVMVRRENDTPLTCHVLNDAVIHKGRLARMIDFEVSIDNQFVFSSRADGLIVSTPSGSTAYALSAGGPIVHPALEAILLVPICPHALSNRPIVVPGQGTVTIGVVEDGLDRLLTLDGQSGFPLEPGDMVEIRRSPHRLKVIHPPQRNYYAVLRDKLRWGERVGRQPEPLNRTDYGRS